MWAEFYTLSEDEGITFEITQTTLCGSTLRLELPEPEKGTRGANKERWCFVDINDDQDFVVGGRVWTDFGTAARRAKHFKHIGRKKAWKLKGLEHQ